MKKTKAAALLISLSLSAGLTTQVPVAAAQETSAQTMADTYSPYIEPVNVVGDSAPLKLESAKPLPKGIKLTFPHHNGQPNVDGSREFAELSDSNDYFLFSAHHYEEPDIWVQKWNGTANDYTTQHFDLIINVNYPDGSVDEVETAVTMTPSMSMVHHDDLQYSTLWIVDGETTKNSPSIANVPAGTIVQTFRDDTIADSLSININPETYEITITPRSEFWDAIHRTNQRALSLRILFEDGSEGSLDIPFDAVGPNPDLHPSPEPTPEPEPQPEPTVKPQPQPEPKPVPKPKKNGSSFFGSSF